MYFFSHLYFLLVQVLPANNFPVVLDVTCNLCNKEVLIHADSYSLSLSPMFPSGRHSEKAINQDHIASFWIMYILHIKYFSLFRNTVYQVLRINAIHVCIRSYNHSIQIVVFKDRQHWITPFWLSFLCWAFDGK